MRFSLFCILICLSFTLSGQKTDKVKDLEAKRKIALSEIEATSKLLNQTKKTQSNILNHLNLLNQQIKTRRDVISLLNQEISSMDYEIKLMEINIASLERELLHKKESYAKSIQKMQFRQTAEDKLLFILSAKDFAQSYRRVRYLKEYAGWQKGQAENIIEKQTNLTKKKEELQLSRQEKQVLLQDREKETYKLEKEESGQKSEIQDLKKQEKSLKAELDKKKKLAQDLNRQIEKAIAEEVEKANREAKLAAESNKKGNETNKETRVAETSGGYAMTKEEQILSANFAGNKGKLPYPLKGNYRIVGQFGQHQHQELKYVKVNSNGIDIQTTAGNDALSVFNGVITKIFTLAGAQNVVIIRHGNYLTVYSNISEISVKTGDSVKTGQKIGKIYTDTEAGNTTILHFELWKETTKLNPEDWLN